MPSHIISLKHKDMILTDPDESKAFFIFGFLLPKKGFLKLNFRQAAKNMVDIFFFKLACQILFSQSCDPSIPASKHSFTSIAKFNNLVSAPKSIDGDSADAKCQEAVN